MSKMNRRKFFSGFGSGILGIGAINLFGKHAYDSQMKYADGNSDQRIIKYNELGNTGLKVSDISFGASKVFSENVVHTCWNKEHRFKDQKINTPWICKLVKVG